MKNIDLLISIFVKEAGPLKQVWEPGIPGVYALEFIRKKIILKILLIETEPNDWVIHHELSKENPFLLKRIVRICERIQRIKDSSDVKFSLSDDLKEIKKQAFISLCIKCGFQNFLNKHCTLFINEKDKLKNGYKSNLGAEIHK